VRRGIPHFASASKPNWRAYASFSAWPSEPP
jgi:hypothetical protein